MSSILARLVDGLRITFLGGLSLFWLAPIIPLIAILPELAQHAAEIRLGMFESSEAFAASAQAPTRWLFAYFKIAGLFVAILAAARYLGGAKKRWWDPRGIAWKRFLIALAINIAFSLGHVGLQQAFGGRTPLAIDVAYQIAGLPLFIYLIGPLYGDTTMTLRRAYTLGWVMAALAGALSLLAWGPTQLLHERNHVWAFGQSEPVIWLLMILDSLLVGLMACWLGAALAAGYWLGRPPGHEASEGPAVAAGTSTVTR